MNNIKEIEQVLETEGVFVSTTVGTSMYPMLRNRRDTIVVKKAIGRLKKYDVPLYKKGESYVLHRVMEVLPDSYIIRGDNCDQKEYGITDDQILGVLEEFYRGDKKVRLDSRRYQAYVRFYCACTPIWWTVRMGRRVFGKIGRIFKRREKEPCV